MDCPEAKNNLPKASTSVLLSHMPSLQCPICYTLMRDPKLLTCGHSFCYTCLSQIISSNKSVACPICRYKTLVDNGTISRLPTNLAFKSVLEEATNLAGKCDLCHTIVKPSNLSYCYDCNITLCSQCKSKHASKSENSDHLLTPHRKGRQWNLTSENYCHEHDKACLYVCTSCNARFCKECLESHRRKCHEIEKISTYALELRSRATASVGKLSECMTKSRQQVESSDYYKYKATAHIDKVISQINDEYQKLTDRLSEEKRSLTRSCMDLKEKLDKVYDDLLTSTGESNSLLNGANDEIDNIMRYARSNRKSCNLLKFDELDREVEEIRLKVSQKAEKLRSTIDESFALGLEKNHWTDKDLIGQVNRNLWVRNAIPLEHPEQGMTCTAVDQKGRIFVGYYKGGVEIYSDRGIEENVQRFKEACVMAMTFSIDGNLILRNTDNVISVYSPTFEQTNARFETIGNAAGGMGDLAVDSTDDIYASYRNIQKVYVYMRTGGMPFREIHCLELNPQQICLINHCEVVVMNGSIIKVIDVHGNTKFIMSRRGHLGYPAVSRDGKLYIAWVNHVNHYIEIVKYTKDLKRHEIVHTNKTTDLSGRRWYYFQVISSGRLVFCTPKTLDIFTPHVRPSEQSVSKA